MPISLQSLWILCALGAPVCTAVGDRNPRVYLGLALGFAAGAGLFRGGVLPEPGWMGGVAAIAAGLLLMRPQWRITAGLSGGFLAGVLGALLQFQGVPLVAALAMAVVLPLLSLTLARRDAKFAPPRIREEALLLLMVLGLGAAVVPAVIEGWRSAGALNAAVAEGVNRAIPAWALALSGISIMLGGAWSLWRHR